MRIANLLLSLLLASATVVVGVGCQKNSALAPTAGVTPSSTQYLYIQEQLDQDTLYQPQAYTSVTQRATTTVSVNGGPTIFGGPIIYSWGGISVTQIATYPGPVPAFRNNTFSTNSNLVTLLGGIGGPGDYFVRWAGMKGPDASLDYNSFSFYFKGATSPYDISRYRGFVFFARGGFPNNPGAKSSFEVGLSAGIKPVGPYFTYNLFSKQFGPELAGMSQWKQFTVYFDTMVQLYGQSIDIKNVLPVCYGLQFDQATPKVNEYFQMDLDYIQMF